MPFVYKGDMGNANSGKVLRTMLLADSTEFTVGDALKWSGVLGYGVLVGATYAVAGIITGFVKATGSPVTDDGASGVYKGTYTTGSSNTVKAIIDVSYTSLWSVALDATIATTAGSDKEGVNFDVVAASDQLDESSVQAAGTTAQFVSFGPDPDPKAPSNSVIVAIQESQYKI
jgi:hypothetical protein